MRIPEAIKLIIEIVEELDPNDRYYALTMAGAIYMPPDDDIELNCECADGSGHKIRTKFPEISRSINGGLE